MRPLAAPIAGQHAKLRWVAATAVAVIQVVIATAEAVATAAEAAGSARCIRRPARRAASRHKFHLCHAVTNQFIARIVFAPNANPVAAGNLAKPDRRAVG